MGDKVRPEDEALLDDNQEAVLAPFLVRTEDVDLSREIFAGTTEENRDYYRRRAAAILAAMSDHTLVRKAEIEQLRAALERARWHPVYADSEAGGELLWHECAGCGQEKQQGHLSDCWVEAALANSEKP